ncbi:hypothetical protein OCOJLMKI_3009 [Methylobacterium iners]|uniref:SGNH/GDSL hydrolase family protein n=1 Tax=Methylobacterium iners TaxID=418707 RepID=A0ABQ4RY78_9HYPH|nr:hypothetical protein OCOJLMKI_3009 [Methylobacterium iners]
MGTPWSGFAKVFLGTAAGLLAGYLALAYAVDPYDSGRSGLFPASGLRPQGPRTAAASRGRDPAYQGAIFGNSHIQLLEPGRLAQATGIPFVQLSVPATGPGEQLVLLDWYLRHHPAPRALVVAADEYWCTNDPALPNAKSFPFWLFSDSPPAYLRGLLRFSVAEEVVNRFGWVFRPGAERARADGWWDYEPDYLKLGYEDDPRFAVKREVPAPDHPEPGRAGPAFPAAQRLAETLRRVPAETALVLVFPPVYAAGLPRPGTPRAAADEACKAAVAGAVRSHGASAVVDWRRPRPELGDPSQFFDQSHYRHPIARALADAIAEAIRDAGAGRR